MNITLTPNLKRLVEQKVKSGSYKNADEVIGDALRLLEKKESVVDNWKALGELDSDIEALVFIVMMQAARDAQEDLKEIMDEMKARNDARKKLRDLMRKVKCDIANSTGQMRLEFGQSGLGSERAYHHVLLPVYDPCAEGGVKLIETDLYKGRISNVSILESIKDDLRDKLDSLSEMGEMESLRLQMIMERRAKFMSTLSNIMKKMSDTAQSITQNLK